MVVDRLTLVRLLDKLKHELNKLERMEFDLEDILADEDIQDMVDRRMQIAIEACIDIAVNVASAMQIPRKEEAADVFRELARGKVINKDLAERMAKATGFRNVLVHEYVDIDYREVYKNKTTGLEDLREFAKQVVDYLGL